MRTTVACRRGTFLVAVAAGVGLLAIAPAGLGNQGPPGPQTDPVTVSWDKTMLKGAFFNQGALGLHGGWLTFEGKGTAGTAAAWAPLTGSGAFTYEQPFQVDPAVPAAFGGLQFLLNATNANSGAFEADIFARPTGTNGADTLVTSGVFGMPNSGSVTFQGTNCVNLRAQQDDQRVLTLAASPDGQTWTPLYTGQLPVLAAVPKTLPRGLSIAGHALTKDTVILAGEPKKKDDTSSIGGLKTTLRRIYDQEEVGRLRISGPGLPGGFDLVKDAAADLDVAIEGLARLPESLGGPGKVALKAMKCAAKADAAGLTALDTGRRAAGLKALLDAKKCKEDALAALDKVIPVFGK